MAARFWLSLLVICVPPLCHAAVDSAYFRQSLYPIMQKAGCPACHNPDGVASGTRLRFPDADASPAAIDVFGKSLARLVDHSAPDQSLLLNKPSRRIAHAGGVRIRPASPEEAVLKNWIGYLATLPPPADTTRVTNDEAPPVKRTPVLRQLTHAQYNNTVRDLLGDDTRIADQFPPEDFVNGFKNQFQGQSISPLLAERYSAAAERLAGNAFRAGDTHSLIPCKPSGPADAVCRDKFVRSFGRRAFRRLLTDRETARYARLFTTEAAARKSFLAGAQIVVEALLQSPAFIGRSENGKVAEWIPYETASRLSYFLWDTMPDEGLLHSAEIGELNTAGGIEKAARRMLADPRARTAVDEFVSEWLRFDRVNGMVKDRRLFPLFTPELALAMAEETRRLAADLVWNNGNFMKLFSADHTFVNSDLAALYNVPAPAAEFGRVPLPESSGRAGILGQALFLAATSKPEETSPTARGLFIREQLLCQEVPPPPPGVNTNLPALGKDQPKTNRERLAIHQVNESCKSCHSLIDPIGFGFEKFDAIGQKREKLKVTFFPGHGEKAEKPTTVDLPLDSSGFVAGIANSEFTSPRELGRVLEVNPQCQECVVKQVFRYAFGRRETRDDRRILDHATRAFRDSGYHFQDLLVALASCDGP
jgi:hypothetical protein